MNRASTPDEFKEESGISLLEILIILGQEKKWIAFVTLLITTITVVASLLFSPIFTSKTTFIVPNPSAGASAAQALSNLGGLMSTGMGATALLSAGKSPDEMYIEFLKSQTMLNGLIEEFDLQRRYGKNSLEKTQKELKNRTKIMSLKKAGLISVAVDDENPQFAAKLANAYVVNLKKLLENFALTEAKMRKEFYEKELIRVKRELQGLTNYQDMKVRESVIAVIMNQYEVAVLDAARESLIQVSEKAVPSEIRSFPKRIFMTSIAFILALILSILFVLIKGVYKRAEKDPEESIRLQQLRRAWSLRK